MSPVALGVAAESVGDVRIVQILVDRVLINGIDWVAETFEACRASMEDGLSPCRIWDAKRVLAMLTTTGRDALARWADAPFERLESNGTACGLVRFAREARERLVPVVQRG